MKKKIAIFASGSGTNFEALAAACENNLIDAEISLLICDKKKAYVIERAKNHNIPAYVFSPKDYASKEEYEELIVEKLEEHNVDLICLAGYMRIVGYVLLRKYEGKIINIHPALLPAFKGAHGIEDAFNYGVKVFGVTIHYVDSGIDSGKIIAQRAFEYKEGDSLEDVERKIHEIEYELYPEVVERLVKGE